MPLILNLTFSLLINNKIGMKKSLLIAAAACLTLSATAAPQLMPRTQKQINIENKLNEKLFRFTTPDGQKMTAMEYAKAHQSMQKAKAEGEGPVLGAFPGEASLYSLDALVSSIFGMSYDYDLPVMVELDEDAAYIDGAIFPGIFSETVLIKADREGNALHIPYQQIYTQFNYMDYYIMDCFFAPVVPDEEMNAILGEDPYEMAIDENGRIYSVGENLWSPDNEEGNVTYFGLWADLSEYGYSERTLFTYICVPNLTPAEECPQTLLPEGAEEVDYIYSFEQAGNKFSQLAQVAQVEDEVYFNYLTGGTGVWVKGTLADGKVTVPSGQGLGYEAVSYIMSFVGISNLVLDEMGYVVSFDVIPELTFNVTEEGYALEEGQIAAIVYGGGDLAWFAENVVINKFAGYEVCKPATPQITNLYDYRDYYGQYYLTANLPLVGTEGQLLNPEGLEFAIYADEDVMTFSPEDDYYLSEDMEWFPANFEDEYGGYDLRATGGSVAFYIYEGLYNELGIQCRYTCDGITNYSNIMMITVVPDEDGYLWLTEIEVENEDDPTGIKNVEAAKVANLFDLQGRRAEKAAKGLVINNGKVNFVK